MTTKIADLAPRLEVEGDDCLSELQADKLHLGEFDGQREKDLRQHVTDCAGCQMRMAFRERGLEGMNVDAARMVAGIEQRLERQQPARETRTERWWSSWFQFPRALELGAVAAAAVVALVIFVPPTTPVDPGVRAKGTASLRVFMQRDGKVLEATSGDRFRAGDRLRFKVNLPNESDASRIMILGVEASGKRSTYYPPDGSSHAAPARYRDDGALAGALSLDNYQGEEWLHLVHCRREFAVSDLPAAEGPEVVGVPADCERISFKLER